MSCWKFGKSNLPMGLRDPIKIPLFSRIFIYFTIEIEKKIIVCVKIPHG